VPALPTGCAAVAREVAAALEADPGFERAPTWHGGPAETGALARIAAQPFVASLVARFGRSALARLAARVVELIALVRPDGPAPGRLAGVLAPRPGVGLGWVETARGLLVHAVEIAGGRVRRYRIVAPTEWNFHPRGALVAGLVGAEALDEDSVRAGATLLVQSLDPCVGVRCEVVRA
jgi:Ni,Fe-hydrogenase I large subunit